MGTSQRKNTAQGVHIVLRVLNSRYEQTSRRIQGVECFMSLWGMMLVVRALLNSRLEKSTLSPLVLSCPPKNLIPTHTNLHETSLEEISSPNSSPQNLDPVDRS
jgi:hypothetical protein